MIQGFKGKYIKDTESAAESIILNSAFTSKIPVHNKAASSTSVTLQQAESDNFDNSIEKKQ